MRRGVGAVGAAAGETARRHRQGQHSTQALRKPYILERSAVAPAPAFIIFY